MKPHAVELLDRDWHVAADRQDLLRPGQAQWRAVGGAGRGDEVSRATGCAQDSRRREGDGEAVCRSRAFTKLAIWPNATSAGWSRTSARWDWRCRAKRAGWTRARGSTRDIGEDVGPRSISHEHTYSHDTAERQTLEATLARLAEMVCRRLREQNLHPRTLQLKLRYSDFRTLTRARTLEQPSSVDSEVLALSVSCFALIGTAKPCACLECMPRISMTRASSLDCRAGRRTRSGTRPCRPPTGCARRFGEGAVSLASGMKARFRERTHENPAGLPGKKRGS